MIPDIHTRVGTHAISMIEVVGWQIQGKKNFMLLGLPIEYARKLTVGAAQLGVGKSKLGVPGLI